MPLKNTTSFESLLQCQIDYLQNEDYAYENLTLFIDGCAKGIGFTYEDTFEVDTDAGTLVIRDGPTDESDNDEVPEHIFRLAKIIASQLT